MICKPRQTTEASLAARTMGWLGLLMWLRWPVLQASSLWMPVWHDMEADTGKPEALQGPSKPLELRWQVCYCRPLPRELAQDPCTDLPD